MSTAMMIVRHCAIAVAIAACTRPSGRAVMDDSTFVATMARLQVIERKTDVSEAVRDSLRRAVLQEQGLTPANLERQARSYADDPAHASAIWTAISRKTASIDTSGRGASTSP
jgi:hypothetical protein